MTSKTTQAEGTHFRFNKEFTYADRLRLKGEVAPIAGQMHDAKLLELGYLAQVDDVGNFVHCSECQRDFENQGAFSMHLQRHAELLADQAPRPASAAPEPALPSGNESDARTGRAAARS